MRASTVVVSLLATLLSSCASLTPQSAGPVHRTLRVDGVDIAYVEQGRGIPVVFVHGAGGDWRTWEQMATPIAREYRYVSVTRRYHGTGPWPDAGERYTFDQHVEDIAAFIRGLGAGKVHLVGNSYSGRLAGYVALRHPELLRSVVLGESSLATGSAPEAKAAAAAYGKELGEAGKVAKAGDHARAAAMVFDAVRGAPGSFDAATEAERRVWLDNARTMPVMFAGRPPAGVSCEQLRALKVPALVVRGERTRGNFRFGHEALLGCLDGAEGAVIPGARHQWNIDNPEASAKTILQFLAKH